MDEWKGVVYFIPGTECSNVCIGQTGRCLKRQLNEYQSTLKNGDVATSALAEHVLHDSKPGHRPQQGRGASQPPMHHHTLLN